MEDLLSELPGKVEVAIGAVSVAGTWLMAKLKSWKEIESKPLKVGIAVGAFLAIALALSILTAPFT